MLGSTKEIRLNLTREGVLDLGRVLGVSVSAAVVDLFGSISKFEPLRVVRIPSHRLRL